MYDLDESYKSKVLSKFSPTSTAYFLLNRYWDQLVLYLLIVPLQWLHLMHLMYSTNWTLYGAVGRLLMAIYLICVFTFWEGLRCLVYYTTTAYFEGESFGDIAGHLLDSLKNLGKGAGKMFGLGKSAASSSPSDGETNGDSDADDEWEEGQTAGKPRKRKSQKSQRSKNK